MREKDYPVEVLEIKGECSVWITYFMVRTLRGLPLDPLDTVLAFAWEPKGDRFMLLTSNDPVLGAGQPGVTIKTSASFYQLDARKGNFRLLSESALHCLFFTPS